VPLMTSGFATHDVPAASIVCKTVTGKVQSVPEK
jgi:hypothetical protein